MTARESKDREYYENVMTFSNPKSINRYYEGSYAKRNDLLFNLMKDYLPSSLRVIDIASGSCQMATNFIDLDSLDSYCWNDFNRNVIKDVEVRIQEGYLGKNSNLLSVHGFDAEDLTAYKDLLAASNLMIGVSMEHIQHDVEIISELNSGTLVGLCSPNFGGKSHVRSFDSMEDFIKRYNSLISVKDTSRVILKNGKEKFLLFGERL